MAKPTRASDKGGNKPRGGEARRPRRPNHAPSDRTPNRARRPKVELDPSWLRELRDTARPGSADRVASHVAAALAAFIEEDYPQAAELASKAKVESPRSGRIRELLGLAYYRMDDFKRAAQELMTYRRITGSHEQNHVIADCYRAVGRVDKAAEAIHEVKQQEVSDEVWTELMIVAGSLHADQGEYERALTQLARAEPRPGRVEPHHMRLLYVKADVLERLGRTSEARRSWERIYSEDPDFFDVSSRLEALT